MYTFCPNRLFAYPKAVEFYTVMHHTSILQQQPMLVVLCSALAYAGWTPGYAAWGKANSIHVLLSAQVGGPGLRIMLRFCPVLPS